MPVSSPSPSITQLIANAVLLPIVLLLVVSAVLAYQVSRMRDDARFIDHSDRVIAQSNDAMKQMIDEETAARGFALTHDRSFLEPLERARVDEALHKLGTLVADRPEQAARVVDLAKEHGEWGSLVQEHLDAPSSLELKTRKSRMDHIREAMARIVDDEERLRADRDRSASERLRTTWSLVVGALVVLIGTIVVVSRRSISVAKKTYETALANESEARRAAEALAEEVRTQMKEVEQRFIALRDERDRALERPKGG